MPVVEYLAQLNPDQHQAVLHHAGPAMVLAGAGSGKTRVLTTRVAYLMDNFAVNPSSILLVTFTNKAAGEMKQRVAALTGQPLDHVGTFHSMAAKILRRHAPRLGLDYNFSIYDDQDQMALIKSLYKQHNYSVKEFQPRSVLHQIGQAKQQLLTPDEFAQTAYSNFQSHVARVYKQYQKSLNQAHALDFEDLLLKVLQLFEVAPDVLEQYQQQFQFVMVDEYQDTNKAQYLITRHLAMPQQNIFIVGDFSQSIYAWRGADYTNMNTFKQDFKDTVEYRLQQNYRSTQPILDIATTIIKNNQNHPILQLWTQQLDGDKPVVHATADQQAEALQIYGYIRQLQPEFSLSDMAILYRTNAQSRAFEELFVKQRVPYQLVGGLKFYERKEIKDLLSYLRILLNPADVVSMERAQKIGKRRLQQVLNQQSQFLEAFRSHPAQMLQEILRVTKYRDTLNPEDPDEYSRLENIEELINVANQFTDTAQFLENVALVQNDTLVDIQDQKDQDQITLMSLHAAKGLEFPVVFMVGMEDGLLPHSRSLFSQDELEEERRLCYVGITRAKQKLFMTYAANRWSYGTASNQVRSRFLNEIPTDMIKVMGEKSPPKNHNQAMAQAAHLDLSDASFDMVLSGELDVSEFLDS